MSDLASSGAVPTPSHRIRPGAVTWRVVDGEVVLLDVAAARYHELNGVASLVWQRLDGGATVDELVEAVLAEYGDASAEQVRADVEAFLEDCARRGWIER